MSGLTHILKQYNVPVRQLINTVCFKNIVRVTPKSKMKFYLALRNFKFHSYYGASQYCNEVTHLNALQYLYLCICRPESYSDDVELAEGLLACRYLGALSGPKCKYFDFFYLLKE